MSAARSHSRTAHRSRIRLISLALPGFALNSLALLGFALNCLVLIASLLSLPSPAHAAAHTNENAAENAKRPPERPLISVEHRVHHLRSAVLNEERRVLVRVPASYVSGNARYPVVYLLDGHEPLLSQVPGQLDALSANGAAPEMILVSIANIDRWRDFTPTRIKARPNTGGADAFLDFIEKELQPAIERQYRTQPYRIFLGHSLGGLLVTHSLLTRPQLFHAHVAASPVLHWDNQQWLQQAGERLAKLPGNLPRQYFAALGEEPAYQEAFSRFEKLLGTQAPASLQHRLRALKDEDHGSIPVPAFHMGLRQIWSGWMPAELSTLDALDTHYRTLETRYGFPVPVPENLINLLGYRLMNAKRLPEAIAAFRRNAELHPQSANAHDSLGEALEQDNQLSRAREHFLRAIELADKAGDRNMQEIFRSHLARVDARLQSQTGG